MVMTDHKTELFSYLEDRLPFHLDLLQQMVSINSFTSNPDGVNAVGDLTAVTFAALGFTAERIQAENPLYGKHMVLTRRARGARNRNHPPTIGLTSHLDTVYSTADERENDFHWRVEGKRIYGPGTNDIKGGTVMIYMMLAALQAVAPDFYDSVTWIILLNAAEEALVPDFGRLCLERLPKSALANLVFEAGSTANNHYKLVAARKGMARYRVEVAGRAAHAGVSHDSGANAIVQISEVIRRIADLTNYENHLTFNVGTVMGGTVINRVPHKASSFVEMRAFTPQIFAEGMQDILALNEFSSVQSVNGRYPCSVQVKVLGEWIPWAQNPLSDRLIDLWRTVGREAGIEVEAEARGGLSDGNWTWQTIPTLDGLGPAGKNAHCSERSADGSKEQEYVIPASYVPKAMLNLEAIFRLVDGHSLTTSNQPPQ